MEQLASIGEHLDAFTICELVLVFVCLTSIMRLLRTVTYGAETHVPADVAHKQRHDAIAAHGPEHLRPSRAAVAVLTLACVVQCMPAVLGILLHRQRLRRMVSGDPRDTGKVYILAQNAYKSLKLLGAVVSSVCIALAMLATRWPGAFSGNAFTRSTFMPVMAMFGAQRFLDNDLEKLPAFWQYIGIFSMLCVFPRGLQSWALQIPLHLTFFAVYIAVDFPIVRSLAPLLAAVVVTIVGISFLGDARGRFKGLRAFFVLAVWAMIQLLPEPLPPALADLGVKSADVFHLLVAAAMLLLVDMVLWGAPKPSPAPVRKTSTAADTAAATGPSREQVLQARARKAAQSKKKKRE